MGEGEGMKSGVIPSSAVGQKINEWYRYIRTFSVPDAEVLKAEIQQELKHMQHDSNLLLYYSLMEFRHQLMLDYLEPLEKLNIEDQPSLSELSRNIDSNQADLKGLLDYYVNFFAGCMSLISVNLFLLLHTINRRRKSSPLSQTILNGLNSILKSRKLIII